MVWSSTKSNANERRYIRSLLTLHIKCSIVCKWWWRFIMKRSINSSLFALLLIRSRCYHECVYQNETRFNCQHQSKRRGRRRRKEERKERDHVLCTENLAKPKNPLERFKFFIVFYTLDFLFYILDYKRHQIRSPIILSPFLHHNNEMIYS